MVFKWQENRNILKHLWAKLFKTKEISRGLGGIDYGSEQKELIETPEGETDTEHPVLIVLHHNWSNSLVFFRGYIKYLQQSKNVLGGIFLTYSLQTYC